MPHLTRGGGGPPAAGTERLGLGVPGYAHPLLAPVEWGELTRPGVPVHWAVLDVADGPGHLPDPHCLQAAGRVRAAGVRLLGRLDLRYGSRPFGELLADAHRFAEWYRVDGYLLDRCPADRTELPAVRRTTEALRSVSGGAADGGHLVLGHGTPPYPDYAQIADQLVTFRGPWWDYRWSPVAEWTSRHPPERFVHLVHGVPRTHLEEAVRTARRQGAGTVFFTDRTARNGAFGTLPGYWDEIVSRIGPGVSE